MHKLLLLGVLWGTAAVAAEPAPQKFGRVVVLSGVPFGHANFHSTGATVLDERLGCYEKRHGGTFGRVTEADAGEVSLEMDGHRYDYHRDKNWGYMLDHDRRAFREGEPLHFRASGGDVPAFDATIRAPVQVALDGLDAEMARDHDWSLEWSGGSTGLVLLSFYMKSGDPQLSCLFHATDRRATIPASLLRKLPAGKLRLRTSVMSRQTFHLRGWVLAVVAEVMQTWKEVPVIDLR